MIGVTMRLFFTAPALLSWLACASAAVAGHSLPVQVCTVYDYTVVGNPVSKTLTRCFDAEMTGPSLEAALEKNWDKIRRADLAETRLWDDIRTVVREHTYLTVALRRVTLKILPNGPTRSADFPAAGAESVAYDRRRVWLRGDDYKFDYFRRGGRGHNRLLDIGELIGKP